jgi:hypothetical protein
MCAREHKHFYLHFKTLSFFKENVGLDVTIGMLNGKAMENTIISDPVCDTTQSFFWKKS